MTLRTKLYKGAVLLAGGQLATQALALLRNIIVARFLSPEDMGIAATFAITLTFLEMISNMAVDMFLVQSKEGDGIQIQQVAQLFQVVRGLFIGGIIFLLASIVANIFHTPQAQWAYQLVALVPVIRGFMHLDWKREQRNLKYGSAVVVEIAPQAIATIAAYPMVIWLNDYSAVLWLVMAQATVSLIVSHIMANRKYRLSFHKEYLDQIVAFGWPLLINGLLIFIGMQGDRFIIGSLYSMSDLGVYSVSASLVLAVAMVVSKASASLLLPVLARVRSEPVLFRNRYVLAGYMLSLIAGVAALPFIVFGGDLIVLIFGEQYVSAHAFAAWFGLFVAARIFRFAPTTAALAHGDSKNSMIANLYRMLGVIGAFVVAINGLPLFWIIISGGLGEALAFTVAAYRIKVKYSIMLADSFSGPAVISIVLVISACVNSVAMTGGQVIGLLIVLLASMPVAMFTLLPLFRKFVIKELMVLKGTSCD